LEKLSLYLTKKGEIAMKHSLKSKLVVLAGLLLFGCSEVEISGRKQFNIVPDSTMNSMSFRRRAVLQNKLH